MPEYLILSTDPRRLQKVIPTGNSDLRISKNSLKMRFFFINFSNSAMERCRVSFKLFRLMMSSRTVAGWSSLCEFKLECVLLRLSNEVHSTFFLFMKRYSVWSNVCCVGTEFLLYLILHCTYFICRWSTVSTYHGNLFSSKYSVLTGFKSHNLFLLEMFE